MNPFGSKPAVSQLGQSMPPLDLIEISDDDGTPVVSQAASAPHRIPALAGKCNTLHPTAGHLLTGATSVVANLNLRIEEVSSNIKSYKDDVASLKELLQSAEERLKKEQEKWSKLVDAKNEALDSGVREINARGDVVKVKKEVKQESKSEVKTGGLRSVFMGVQGPLENGAGAATSRGTHPLSKPAIIKAEPEPLPTQCMHFI